MTRAHVVAMVAAITLALTVPASAGPGDLDRSFGRTGVAVVDFGGIDRPVALAAGPGGRVVVAGYSGTSTGDAGWDELDIAVARFTRDGLLDESFGRRGKVKLDLGALEHVRGVAVARDGKIIVLATRAERGSTACCSALHVVRLRANGKLDRNFGDAGVRTIEVPVEVPFERGAGLVVGRDGAIVVASTVARSVHLENVRLSAGKVLLARLDVHGNLDPTFGIGGLSVIGRGTRDQFGAIGADDGGSMLVATTRTDPLGTWVALERVLPSGILDASFGAAERAPPASGHASVLARDAAGRIVVGAERWWCFVLCDRESIVVRYGPDGVRDMAFGNGGAASLPYDGRINAMSVAADGKIVLATTKGSCWFLSCEVSAGVARLTRSGRLDVSFGRSGHAQLPQRLRTADAGAMSSGRILVAGEGGARSKCWFWCLSGSYVYANDFVVTRIQP